MIGEDVGPGRRHESRESAQEVERLEDDVGGPVPPRVAQGVDDPAVLGEREALGGDGRASDVAAQALEALVVVRIDAYLGVERDAVDAALGGDVNKVARYQVRFAGVGYPGETYRISYWREGDKILIETRSVERDNAAIITNAAITVRD